MMKRWLGLVLAGLGVCWLLVLSHWEAGRGVDSYAGLACGGRCLGAWGEPPLARSPAAGGADARPRETHTAPSQSRAVHGALWTERGVGPPWLNSRGPPGKVRWTWVNPRAAGQIGSLKAKGEPALPQQGPKHPLAGTTAGRGFCNSL